MAVVQQSIEDRGGDHRVAEHAAAAVDAVGELVDNVSKSQNVALRALASSGRLREGGPKCAAAPSGASVGCGVGSGSSPSGGTRMTCPGASRAGYHASSMNRRSARTVGPPSFVFRMSIRLGSVASNVRTPTV